MQLVVEGQQVNVTRQSQRRFFKADSHAKARPQSSLSGHSQCVSSDSSDDGETEDIQVIKAVRSPRVTTCRPFRQISPGLQGVPKQRIPLKKGCIKRTLAVSLPRPRVSSGSMKMRPSGLAVFGARAGDQDSGISADTNFDK